VRTTTSHDVAAISMYLFEKMRRLLRSSVL
jgi:hypothetical protein